ncbi:MAG TPA: hypothetical protein VF660_02860 [Actinomycetota bacterium]
MGGIQTRLRELAHDRRSGAAEIARNAVDLLAALPTDRMMEGATLLLRGHPSMAPLWRLASALCAAESPGEGGRLFADLLDADQAAVAALHRVVHGRRVLTISYSSSVAELVRVACPVGVLCMRSEPGGEGIHMARAVRGWTETSLVDDATALRDPFADVVVAGADAVTPTSVINKVKTRALAEAAHERGIPVYAIAGETKFIGAELPLAPLFEPTPLELFSAVAAPHGLLDPAAAAEHARLSAVHPSLVPLLSELGASAP